MKRMKLTTFIIGLLVLLPVMADAFPTSFYWSNVYYENLKYDNQYPSPPSPFTRIMAEVLLDDHPDYNPGDIAVKLVKDPYLSQTYYSVPYIFDVMAGGSYRHLYSNQIVVNPIPLSDWEKPYQFIVEGKPLLGYGSQMILPRTLKEVPFVEPIIIGNTISWSPVQPPLGSDNAYIRYRLTIFKLGQTGYPFGQALFSTDIFTTTSYTFSPLPPPLQVGETYALRIEAREYPYYYSPDFLNRSSLWTKFTPVPIPSTLLLLGAGLLGLAGLGRLRKR